MTIDEMRQELTRSWEDLNAAGLRERDAYLPSRRLVGWYKRLDGDDRLLANEVISSWVNASDDRMQYDAMVLIRECHIIEALPMLRHLLHGLRSKQRPEQSVDPEVIASLIARLVEQHGSDAAAD